MWLFLHSSLLTEESHVQTLLVTAPIMIVTSTKSGPKWTLIFLLIIYPPQSKKLGGSFIDFFLQIFVFVTFLLMQIFTIDTIFLLIEFFLSIGFFLWIEFFLLEESLYSYYFLK